MHKKTLTNSVLSAILLLIICAVYIVLPSLSPDSLMNGTQSGKTIIFLYLVITLGPILLLKSLVTHIKEISFKINFLDIPLFISCLYIILNNLLQHIPLSGRMLEFCGLIILYISLRQMHPAYFTWLFLALTLGAGIQAVYGNLQLWGYYPSHHGLFKMTGSFFNPGPYAGYLAVIFPTALSIYLQKVKPHETILNQSVANLKQYETAKRLKSLTIEYFILIVIITLLLVLPASRSRAAWLAVIASSGYVFIGFYKDRINVLLSKYLNSFTSKTFALILSIILIGSLFIVLYNLKSGSADGRMLIWKVTLNMIREKPVTGFGMDQFKAHYMDYQAAYFKHNTDSAEAMFAGDTNYAFNEFLQQIAEEGILWLLFILFILFIIFVPSKIQSFKRKENYLQTFSSGISDYRIFNQKNSTYINPHQNIESYLFIITAKSGIISLIVFALFSYPVQILPIKTSLLLYLATLAGFTPQRKIFFLGIFNKRLKKLIVPAIKIIFSVVVFILIYTGSKYIYRYSEAYRNWHEAYSIYQLGAYEACLEDYEKAWPVLKTNGDFLTNYGKALSMAEKHEKAVEILLQAAKYCPNVIVYTALGDSYKQLGKAGKAEQAYLHAWHMNPSRFYPKFLLAKLYNETGQKEKAVLTANELLKKQIKVPSTAIDEIKEEMQHIIIQDQGLD